MTVIETVGGRKSEIQGATLALAFELGPDRVTTGMIAKRLGVSQPAIYKHFADKEDLWQSITDLLGAQIAENIARAAAEAQDPVDRLRRLILGHLRLVQQTPALPEIMVARDAGGAQNVMQRGLRASAIAFTDAMTGAVREAQASGRFRDDIAAQDMAVLVLGIVQSLVLRLLISRDPSVLQADAERLLDLQVSFFSSRGDTR